MRMAQQLRPTAWDVLEGRALPSRIGGAGGPAVTPRERVDAYAVMRHAQDLEQARAGDASVVFLGDSISDNWGDVGRDGPGAAVWRERIAPLNAANFGVPGDTTGDVLWRIADGELAGKPQLVVLEIGTNNLGVGHTADETAAGITAVVDAVLEASPRSRILLMGIFPRGEGVDDPLTRAALEVNSRVAHLADGDRVRFLDIGPAFLDPDGTVDESLLPDRLHPNALGYEVWADALIDAMHGMSPSRTPAAGAGAPRPAPDPSSGLVLIAPPLDEGGSGLPEVPGIADGPTPRKVQAAWWQTDGPD